MIIKPFLLLMLFIMYLFFLRVDFQYGAHRGTACAACANARKSSESNSEIRKRFKSWCPSQIRKALPQRKATAVWSRLHRITHPGNGKGGWTAEQDAKLRELHGVHGNQWKTIGAELERMPEVRSTSSNTAVSESFVQSCCTQGALYKGCTVCVLENQVCLCAAAVFESGFACSCVLRQDVRAAAIYVTTSDTHVCPECHCSCLQCSRGGSNLWQSYAQANHSTATCAQQIADSVCNQLDNLTGRR